ncbi:hypothetical protein HPB49_020552 [Dermacentor silvarum]|uniref:Uncharacterized protein n=1 Tax=Dermacentor silvarum TaxID=543639 RepID=A0ACB8CZS4_DERSI|nr:hypothetical protein HPB49_020552 [Dermacentor silvarum]
MTRIAETTPQECPLFVEPPMVLPPDNFYGSEEGDEENACFLARSMDCSGEEHYQQEPHRQAGNTDDSMNDLRSIRTLEVDIEIDDVVCRKVKVIVVSNSALPADTLVGRTWTEQDHIAYLRMGDELRIGNRDDLPFCNIDLVQIKPSKEPLCGKETIVLPKITVLGDSGDRIEIPMLNDKDEYQQLINGSLFAHAQLLSGSEELTTLNQVIHNNGGFTDIDKFTSLRSVLTGDAALETAGLPATASCYSDALEILKERFAKDNLIILNHMQRLIDLQPVRSPNYLRGVRSLYDTVQSQTRALKTLKVSEDNYSSMLYPIFLKSLPHDIVLDFNKTIHCTPEFGGKGRSWKHWRTSTAYPATEGEH